MKTKIFGITVFLIIFGLFGYFISKNVSVIRETFDVTTSSLTSYGLFAFIVSIFSYIAGAYAFKRVLRLFNIMRNIRQTLCLQLKGLAANIIIPTGGFASALIYAEDAGQNGESKEGALSAGIMWLLIDYTAISIVLLLAIIYLISIKSLHAAVWVPAIGFFGITTLVYVLAILSARRHEMVKKLIVRIARTLGRFIKKIASKENKIEESADNFVTEYADANRHLMQNKIEWLKLIGIVLVRHFLNIVVLYTIFSSLGVEATWRNVLVGYAIGITVLVISPTPMGIGFVEAAMTLAYVSLGLPPSVAGTTAIIFRAYVFWIPFFVGFILLQRSRLRKIKQDIRDLKIE